MNKLYKEGKGILWDIEHPCICNLSEFTKDKLINLIKEYKNSTSAQHPNKDEDIVRAANIHEIAESKDKES